ncbi:hypothetical protein C8Q77DRAFT_1052682 [Trametes polyzona]|nr:hypothetical protein C8Q77DRAFT_1052682 [Trametes polyzona]
MFYSRPALIPHTKKIIVGLPPKRPYASILVHLLSDMIPDVLNRFYPSWHTTSEADKGVWVDPDPREQMEKARKLSKYVFPRQYGLSNPISSDSTQTSYAPQPDYVDREHEIKLKGPCKTPKRLKSVLGILEQMIWKHHKCRYKALLNLACPSKVYRPPGPARGRPANPVQLKTDDSTPLDSSVILVQYSVVLATPHC